MIQRSNSWKSLTDKGDNSNNNDEAESDPKKEEPKAIKMAKELQKEKREAEQLNIDPEQVLEEQEKRQPQSADE
ncbi:MAG: hypothetical protein WA364_04075 [Candidatus Nitrosopolaris sp.]